MSNAREAATPEVMVDNDRVRVTKWTFAPGAARVEHPAQLVVDVNRYRPGERMFALVAVAAALVQAFDPVDHGELTEQSLGAQRRQVGLGDRSGNT